LANPELGAKQICPNCQTKFYDLNRRPAVCPKCGLDFDPEEAVRSRRVRTRAVAPEYEADEPPAKPRADEEEAEGFEDEAVEAPEIDEAAEAEPLEADEPDESGAPAGPEPDLGVDFEEEAEVAEDEGEDVPFLEEEDEGFPEDEIGDLPDEEDH
jgi:uncharacterized protein (TIGR02300 family)